MRTTHRRYWVFFLLFLFSAIAYLDRVNMSVAGKPIAHEFGLSPIELGYLFSSFLWAYVLMMLPGGRLIDRWGTHVMAPVATAIWSGAQVATGMVGSFATMLAVRARFRNRRGALRADFLWQRSVVVALYRARYRHCRDLGRVQPRAGARRAGRGLRPQPKLPHQPPDASAADSRGGNYEAFRVAVGAERGCRRPACTGWRRRSAAPDHRQR
jgi:hypothetical protein